MGRVYVPVTAQVVRVCKGLRYEDEDGQSTPLCIEVETGKMQHTATSLSLKF